MTKRRKIGERYPLIALCNIVNSSVHTSQNLSFQGDKINH